MSRPAAEVYAALEATFEPWRCTEVFPKIGLQYGHADTIEQVYTACFAGGEVFERLMAEDAGDCLLFTHHPVGQRAQPADPPPAIEPRHLDFLRRNRISLFSYHIPLDRNGLYSPGNRLAQALDVVPYGEFYEQNGVKMGVLCQSRYATAQALADGLEQAVGHRVALYPYGGDALAGGRLAIMAGGAKNHAIYAELMAEGINLFLTGVTNPAVEWVGANHRAAQAAGVGLLGGSHYSTEKFAPMAMVEFFQSLGLPAVFLPEAPRLGEL